MSLASDLAPRAPSAERGPVVRTADGRVVNGMSCDVEDYFQVQAFADRISRADWDGHETRVARNTHAVLDLFAEKGVKGTFFTLGWIAERNPSVVRRIVAEGHELASHGWAHHRADQQTPETFRDDVRRTKSLLEDIGGVAVRGYRAATFSINTTNPWTFAILEEEGHAYSSSVYPVRHDLYGVPDAPRFPYRPAGADRLWELPITTVRLGGRNVPCGGGGYFRLLPYTLSRWAMGQVNATDVQPCIFYFHPWEIDPGQPRMTGISAKTRLRHYTNLSRMRGRLSRVLDDFAWDRMDTAFGLAP